MKRHLSDANMKRSFLDAQQEALSARGVTFLNGVPTKGLGATTCQPGWIPVNVPKPLNSSINAQGTWNPGECAPIGYPMLYSNNVSCVVQENGACLDRTRNCNIQADGSCPQAGTHTNCPTHYFLWKGECYQPGAYINDGDQEICVVQPDGSCPPGSQTHILPKCSPGLFRPEGEYYCWPPGSTIWAGPDGRACTINSKANACVSYDPVRKCIMQDDKTCIPVPPELQELTERYGVAKFAVYDPKHLIDGYHGVLSSVITADVYVPAVLLMAPHEPSPQELIQISQNYKNPERDYAYEFDFNGDHYSAVWVPDNEWSRDPNNRFAKYFRDLREKAPWVFNKIHIIPTCGDAFCTFEEIVKTFLIFPVELLFDLLDEILPCGSPQGEAVAKAFSMYGSQLAHAIRCGGAVSGCPAGQVPTSQGCIPNPCTSPGTLYNNVTGKCDGGGDGGDSNLPWIIAGVAGAGLLAALLISKKKKGDK